MDYRHEGAEVTCWDAGLIDECCVLWQQAGDGTEGLLYWNTGEQAHYIEADQAVILMEGCLMDVLPNFRRILHM